MVFLSLYASVRLACYQGKMYSRHLFPYKRLSYIFLCFKIKTRKNQLGLNKIHSKAIHKIGITLMTHPIPVEGSFKTSASPIETFRFCEPSKLGGIADMLYTTDLKRVWVQSSRHLDSSEGACHKMATRTSSNKRFVGHCYTRALHKRYEPFYITELSSSKQREITIICVFEFHQLIRMSS